METTQVTLKQVAARANRDSKFFKAVISRPLHPNRALAKYGIHLSAKEKILRAALTKIKAIDVLFSAAFGGWGRWPR